MCSNRMKGYFASDLHGISASMAKSFRTAKGSRIKAGNSAKTQERESYAFIRIFNAKPCQSAEAVASAPTVAQQSGIADGPAIRLPVVHLPRQRKAIWSCVGPSA